MKYSISKDAEGIDISVKNVKNNKDRLLAAFQECQEGRCSCPTSEYTKLESLEVALDDQGLRLRLTPKNGLQIDTSEIERCLLYTSERVEEETGD